MDEDELYQVLGWLLQRQPAIEATLASLPAAAFDDATAVRSYKSLACVERAFRCMKTVDLHVRPVYHWLV